MANEKIISQSVFEEAIKDILTELVNSTYQWEEYTPEQISDILEITDEEAMQLTKILNDQVVANNKLWSSSKTDAEIKNALIESNKYSDELIGKISSISLEYVTTLPTSDIKSNVIYILQGTPNTLNVFNESASSFVSVGDLNLDLSGYYTSTQVDNLLADKADDNTVVHADAIVADLTTTSGSTVLSSAGLQTELDKKIDKTSILTAKDNSATDDQVYSAKAINTELGEYAKTVDLPTPRTDEEILAVINKEGLQFIDDANDTTLTNGRYATKTTTTNLPVSAYGILTVDKYKDTNSTWIKQTYKPLADQIYVRSKINSLEWTAWDKVITNSIEKYQIKNYNNDLKVNNTIEKLEDLLKLVPSGQTWYIPDFNIDQTVTDYGFPEGARQWGTMTITNSISSGHYLIELQSNTNYQVEKRWVGETRHVVAGSNQPYQVKWQKLCTTTVADSEGTATMSDGATGNVTYKVINGVCYVSILNLADGLTGNPCCSFEGLPKSSIPYVNIGIENNGTRVGTTYSNGGERFLVIKTSGLSGHCSFSYPVAES